MKAIIKTAAVSLFALMSASAFAASTTDVTVDSSVGHSLNDERR